MLSGPAFLGYTTRMWFVKVPGTQFLTGDIKGIKIGFLKDKGEKAGKKRLAAGERRSSKGS